MRRRYRGGRGTSVGAVLASGGVGRGEIVGAGSRSVTAPGLKEDLTSGSCMSGGRREVVLRG
jgi:hypothetical protein